VTQSSALLALLDEPVWFCLKAQPKREHLAAIALRRQFGIECFSPRLRFRKMTNRGPVWFVEAMFPGYLFTKFVYSKQHRAVEASHGIRGIDTNEHQCCSALEPSAGDSGLYSATTNGHPPSSRGRGTTARPANSHECCRASAAADANSLTTEGAEITEINRSTDLRRSTQIFSTSLSESV